MPGSTGHRHNASEVTWCSWPISAIRWPVGHVYMPERQHRLSLGSYGRPRMTEELNELGLQASQRRVGRLMRQNGIQIVRTRKFKVEEGQKMIRGIIFPRTHRQRPHLQHRAESLAARLQGERAEPEVPSHGLQANHCRVTGG